MSALGPFTFMITNFAAFLLQEGMAVIQKMPHAASIQPHAFKLQASVGLEADTRLGGV